jgi:Na+-transporting NADH:ubiquinone oxidoreductase subunit NqrD
MALSLTFVTAFSSLFISMLRNTIPSRIRIIVQLAVVALWVILGRPVPESLYVRCCQRLISICRINYY